MSERQKYLKVYCGTSHIIDFPPKYVYFQCYHTILVYIYVVVNFLFQVIFIFLLFLGMVIYANEVETKEK